jgi:tetratricopeptide (TPR) repeat protein
VQPTISDPARALPLASAFLVTVMAVLLVAYVGSGPLSYVASLIPGFASSEEQRWNALALANKRFEAECFHEAISAFDDLIRRAPNFKQAHAGRGHALVAVQRYEDAITAYTTAIEIDREYPGPYLGRAWTRWFTGQVASAADDYRELVRLEPDNADFNLELTRVLYELDRPGEVAALWAEYYRRNPDVTNARIWRAQALEKAEGWSTLRQELRELVDRQPFVDSAQIQYLYGRALNEARSHREAIAPLRRAVQLARDAKPRNAGALQQFGDELTFTYLWAGNANAAQQLEAELKEELRQEELRREKELSSSASQSETALAGQLLPKCH